jgi:hypothetical protein
MSMMTSPVTVLNAVTATGASIAQQPGLINGNKVNLQVTGITTATVALEGSVDGTTFFTVGTVLTANGLVSDDKALPYYRANVTAYTAGTITAKMIW